LGPYFSRTEHRSIQWALSNGLESGSGLMVLSTSKEPLAISHLNYTLFDYFHDQGFKVSLILSGDHKKWLLRNALGQGLDLVHDGSDFPGPQGPFDDQIVLNELGNLGRDDGGRHFFYIHLMSVHQTAPLLDEYARYRPYHNFIDPKYKPGYQKDAEDIQEIVNMYDDRILQMDDFMGKILTLLRTKGYLKDFVGVFTADHGQLLGEKGLTGHGYYPLVGGLHIPLVFFSSQRLPSFDQTHFATQMDIAPTLTDLAGLTPPSIWEGQSLLRKRKDPWSFLLSPTTRPGVGGAVVYGTATKLLKYSRLLDPDKKGPEELYDLDADPEEKNNLVGTFDPKQLGEFREKANQHLGEF
jgi:membrane-anchored protein YejM (alkaline phosphatase superfamily)